MLFEKVHIKMTLHLVLISNNETIMYTPYESV